MMWLVQHSVPMLGCFIFKETSGLHAPTGVPGLIRRGFIEKTILVEDGLGLVSDFMQSAG